jgi:hypothetical protein
MHYFSNILGNCPLKIKGRLIRSPVCLSVYPFLYPPLTAFEPTDGFHEIQHGCHPTEGGLDAIVSNPTASTLFKWRIFRLLRWMQNQYQSALDYEGLSSVTIVGRQKSTVVKKLTSLLGPILEQDWDARVPIVVQQWSPGT